VSGQSNSANFYSLDKLSHLKSILEKRRVGFSKNTVKGFLTAARQKDLHGELSPELKSFLEFLDNFIKGPEKKLVVKDLVDELDSNFAQAQNPQNTMWQIRFLNYVFDNEMRQKLHIIEEPDILLKFAGVQRKIQYDSQGNEWQVATHQSLGKGSRAFEQPYQIFNNFPDGLIAIERIDENYSTVEDQEAAEKLANLVRANFNKESLLRVPDIKLKTEFFENKSEKQIVKLMNEKPVSEFLKKLVEKNSFDGKSLLELSQEQYTMQGLLLNGEESSSLIDFYLYRVNAYQSGRDIVAYEDSQGNALDFDLGFDPENYEGEEGRKQLAIDAFNFFKEEALERPASFLDYIFENKYQLDVNLRTAFKGFKEELKRIPKKQSRDSFNLSVVIDLGDNLMSMSIGDGILMPIYHQDTASTAAEFEGLKDAHNLKDYVTRIELGKAPKKGKSKIKLPEYLGGVFDKDDVEAFFMTSKNMILNMRRKKGQKPKKAFRRFFNEVVAPYIQNKDKDTQRDKDKKFLARALSFTNDDNALGMVFLSHKISDDNESEAKEGTPSFNLDNDPTGSFDRPSPWQDAPVDSNTPLAFN
jgi:hypothetical protein